MDNTPHRRHSHQSSSRNNGLHGSQVISASRNELWAESSLSFKNSFQNQKPLRRIFILYRHLSPFPFLVFSLSLKKHLLCMMHTCIYIICKVKWFPCKQSFLDSFRVSGVVVQLVLFLWMQKGRLTAGFKLYLLSFVFSLPRTLGTVEYLKMTKTVLLKKSPGNIYTLKLLLNSPHYYNTTFPLFFEGLMVSSDSTYMYIHTYHNRFFSFFFCSNC